MKDPRFRFKKKFGIDPLAVLNYFFVESVKFRYKKNYYGVYKRLWLYVKNTYGVNISYYQLLRFIHSYQKFMQWISKGKPVDLYVK